MRILFVIAAFGIASAIFAQKLPPHLENSLGVPGYPGATVRDPENPVTFYQGTAQLIATTADSPDKVMAFFKKHLNKVKVTACGADRYLPDHPVARILELNGTGCKGRRVGVKCTPVGKRSMRLVVTSMPLGAPTLRPPRPLRAPGF